MFREWLGPEPLALLFILYPRVLSQAFKRQPELRTLITHSMPSGEFLLRLLLTVSKSALFDFLAINRLFSFQLLILRWAVPRLALTCPFPPHGPFSALIFQAQPQVPCIPVAALMGRRGHEAWPCEWDWPAAEEVFPGQELGGRTDVDPCFVFLVFNHQRTGLVLGIQNELHTVHHSQECGQKTLFHQSHVWVQAAPLSSRPKVEGRGVPQSNSRLGEPGSVETWHRSQAEIGRRAVNQQQRETKPQWARPG